MKLCNQRQPPRTKKAGNSKLILHFVCLFNFVQLGEPSENSVAT